MNVGRDRGAEAREAIAVRAAYPALTVANRCFLNYQASL
jgi:hypothetical protein